MAVESLRLLLVGDEPAAARWFADGLRDSVRPWCVLSHATSLAAAVEVARSGDLDAVLLDLSLLDAHGVESVSLLRTAAPSLPVVVLTDLDDEQAALRAAKAGAQDYLIKDHVRGPLLARAVRYAIERKRADDSQRREAAAAQTAQLREQFISVLGHDLRNPLSSISMSAGLLLKNADMGERPLKAVARIVRSADRMNRMIRDLLDFARTRLGGGYSLSIVAGSLREICQHVVDDLKAVHQDRTLIFTAQDKCWGEWDADRLAQMTSNLISNAMQYSPSETPVRITLRQGFPTGDQQDSQNSSQAGSEQGSHAILEVTNQGPPIAPDMLPVLFEPSRRVQPSASGGSTQGLGLGLYIAHQIVLAHHGRVDVRSVDGEGTTFTVRLPRSQPPTADQFER